MGVEHWVLPIILGIILIGLFLGLVFPKAKSISYYLQEATLNFIKGTISWLVEKMTFGWIKIS